MRKFILSILEAIDMKKVDNKSKLEITRPRLLEYLIDKNSEFVRNIHMVSKTIEDCLNRIPIIFPNYTLHDINHSIRIMEGSVAKNI